VLPLMLGLGVPYRFVAKLEVGEMPFIGTFLKQMGHLKFDRTDPQSRLRQARSWKNFAQRRICFLSFRKARSPERMACDVPTWRFQGCRRDRRAGHSGVACRNTPLSA